MRRGNPLVITNQDLYNVNISSLIFRLKINLPRTSNKKKELNELLIHTEHNEQFNILELHRGHPAVARPQASRRQISQAKPKEKQTA